MRLIGFILILIFYSSVIIAAPSISFQNEDILAGETILGTIENGNGNFTEIIRNSNIEFFEGRKSVFIESEIFYYNQKHYFYIYPNKAGNFSISVKNILYKEDDQLKSLSLEKNFIVKKGDLNKTQILSIRPGVIYYEEPKIRFSNIGNSDLEISFSPELNYKNETKTKKINILPETSIELYFRPQKNFSFININSYKKFEIPVFHLINDSYSKPEENLLKFNPQLVLKNLVAKKKENVTIELFNFGENEIRGIKITSGIKFLKTSELENLSAKGAENLTVFISPEDMGHFNGNLYINYEQENKTTSISIPFDLFVLPAGTNLSDIEISEKTCSQMNGTVCPANEICEGVSSFSKGGEYCCLGLCKKIEKEDSSTTWFFGILIFILIGIVVFFLYRKSKRARQKTPDEKLNEISKKYIERVQGKIER